MVKQMIETKNMLQQVCRWQHNNFEYKKRNANTVTLNLNWWMMINNM